MAVAKRRGEWRGVAPAVVHWVRLVSESSVDLQLECGRLVVSLYSGSWIFAGNLELGPAAVLGTVLGMERGTGLETGRGASDLALFLSALITTPSSKDPSSCSHERDPLTSVDTVEAKSSAAAGPARRSAVATMSSSSSIVTLLFGETGVRAVDR